VVLTIDRTIQHIAQKALETSITQFEAQSGIAVVMVPATGEILALAHYPFFNPNSLQGFWAGIMAEPGHHRPIRARLHHEDVQCRSCHRQRRLFTIHHLFL
jgi:cell division protein FtsI/penicillin-binding protein 2